MNKEELNVLMKQVDQLLSDIANCKNRSCVRIYKDYNKYYPQLMQALKNAISTGEEISFTTCDGFFQLKNSQNIQKYFIKQNDMALKVMRDSFFLDKIFEGDRDLFHQIIKDDYSICGEVEFPYDSRVHEDHLFNYIVKQIDIIKDFEQGKIKLSEIDDYILHNDYNMARICNAVADKLYSTFSDKLDQAGSPEQSLKIKELLDKKIENIIEELTTRRENSLKTDLDNNQKEIENYDV